MSVGTTLPPRNATSPQRRWRSARSDLAKVRERAAQMVSAARHHNWGPALTISGLASIDAAFYQHGWFAGLLATGISILAYDWQREK